MSYPDEDAISSQIQALNSQIKVIDGQVHQLCAEWYALRPQLDQAIIDWRACDAYPGDLNTLLAYSIKHEPMQYHLILVDQTLSRYPDHPLYRLTERAVNVTWQLDHLVATRKEMMRNIYSLLDQSQGWATASASTDTSAIAGMSAGDSAGNSTPYWDQSSSGSSGADLRTEDGGSGRRWWINSESSGGSSA